jgi:hypothetical protein
LNNDPTKLKKEKQIISNACPHFILKKASRYFVGSKCISCRYTAKEPLLIFHKIPA